MEIALKEKNLFRGASKNKSEDLVLKRLKGIQPTRPTKVVPRRFSTETITALFDLGSFDLLFH